MKVLIAVLTCHKRRARADSQRSTWVPLVRGADVRFFVGTGGFVERPDEILLNVPDDYLSLPYKSQAVFQWAIDRGYHHVFKIDDDVYVAPERLLASDFQHDYVGHLNDPEDRSEPYASGFAYWVNRRAMRILVDAAIDDWAEDRWVGHTLNAAGIFCYPDCRYTVIHSLNKQNPVTGIEAPLASNDILAVAELDPVMMRRVHAEWLAGIVAPVFK